MDEHTIYGREKVDLTVEQSRTNEEQGTDDMDDFDLLEATIDPTDVKSLERRNKLLLDLQLEQDFMRAKLLFKRAMSADNPFKLDE